MKKCGATDHLAEELHNPTHQQGQSNSPSKKTFCSKPLDTQPTSVRLLALL